MLLHLLTPYFHEMKVALCVFLFNNFSMHPTSSNTKKDNRPNLKGRYCPMPFTSMELHLNQETYVCCPSWMKKSIGTFSKDNILEIWNSPSAQEIRASIIDGSYRYCDAEMCPNIQNLHLPKIYHLSRDIRNHILKKSTMLTNPPRSVMFTFDASCNLSCPSCRPEKVSLSADSPKYRELNELSHALTDTLLKDPNSHVKINITGSGDPFASLAFRHYLEKIDGSKYPNLKFDFQTNGLLLTPLMWERMSKIHKNINSVSVSIDASTPETYSIVRRGGRFEVLMENMIFLASLRKKRKLDLLQVNFVVQQKNYKEIPSFAKTFIKLGCDKVSFSRIVDWGSYHPDDFFQQTVWQENHPEFNQFITVLSDPIMQHHKIYPSNITPFIELAIERQRQQMGFLDRSLSIFVSYTRKKYRNLLQKIRHFLLGNSSY